MGSNPKKYYNVRSYSELRSKLLGDKYTECEPGRSVEKWGTLGCPVQFSGYEVHKDRLGRSTEVVVFWRKCKVRLTFSNKFSQSRILDMDFTP